MSQQHRDVWERWAPLFEAIGPPPPLPADAAELWEAYFRLHALRASGRVPHALLDASPHALSGLAQ